MIDRKIVARLLLFATPKNYSNCTAFTHSTVDNAGLNAAKESHSKQLQLFAREHAQPAISIKLAPGSHHRSKIDRFWIVCNHVGKPFGGLFYKREVEFIKTYFTGRTGPIEPREFGQVAERAISYFTQKEGV